MEPACGYQYWQSKAHGGCCAETTYLAVAVSPPRPRPVSVGSSRRPARTHAHSQQEKAMAEVITACTYPARAPVRRPVSPQARPRTPRTGFFAISISPNTRRAAEHLLGRRSSLVEGSCSKWKRKQNAAMPRETDLWVLVTNGSLKGFTPLTRT